MNKEKVISEHMASLAKRRWSKVPQEDRSKQMKALVALREAKRLQRASSALKDTSN